MWTIPTFAVVLLWHPVTTLAGSGGPGVLLGLLLVWVTLIPLVRAAIDVGGAVLRRR